MFYERKFSQGEHENTKRSHYKSIIIKVRKTMRTIHNNTCNYDQREAYISPSLHTNFSFRISR